MSSSHRLSTQSMLDAARDHHRAGRLQEAEAGYREILTLQPNHADALHLLGVIAHQTGNHTIAEKLILAAIASDPDTARFHNNLGLVQSARAASDRAVASYQTALRLDPNYPEAHYNLGNILFQRGDFEGAAASFQSALVGNPGYIDAHNNLGLTLGLLGKTESAIISYRNAIELKPDHIESINNLANVLEQIGEMDEAEALCRTALALDPKRAAIFNNLGNIFKDRGQISQAIESYRFAVQLEPGNPTIHSNLLLSLHYSPDFDSTTILAEHRNWNDRHARPLQSSVHAHPNDPDPFRRLKIGYVSPDFVHHAVGRFLHPLLENHDLDKVQVFSYSDTLVPDHVTHRIRACSQHWRDIAPLSDEQVTRQIRQDQIDVLVDLAAHTNRNRLLVFARKPAPVQMTYLAYPSTTGLDTMDYRLTDAHLDPPEFGNGDYSEESIRLPDTYWCYPPPSVAGDEGKLPALSNGYITFGCLNNFCKVNEPTLELWARVLDRIPSSRLTLSAPRGETRIRVQRLMHQHRVDPSRLNLVDRVSLSDYFGLYRTIDIGLDPFPFTGGTTTCDALWMGVPVISYAGPTAVSRAGRSLLSNVGLSEFAARSQEDYVRLATELVNDLKRLGTLRQTLRQQMQDSPLMNGRQFARDMERVYRDAWRRWCRHTNTQP